MRKYLFLLTLLLSLAGWSQKREQATIDSLQRLLATTQKGQTPERASTLLVLGKSYLNEADYIHAQQCFSECLAIADKTGDRNLMALSYRDIGVIYFHQHDYDKAGECDQKAFSIFEKLHNAPAQAEQLKRLGDNYLQQGDSAKATRYFNEALLFFKQQNDKQNEAAVYSNQAILCNANYQAKIELGLRAKSIWDSANPYNELPAVNTGNIGVAYLDIVRYDSLHKVVASSLIPADRDGRLRLAEKYLTEAIEMSNVTNDPENSAYFTGVLAELEEQKGDYKSAYYNFRKYQNVTDSIFSQENKNKIAAIESQRTLDLKNREIENKELQIGNQHKKMLLLAAAMAFLLIIGVFIYRQSLTRKKTNTILRQLNKELDEANKVKATFFGILSHDLRSPVANLINFLQLQKRRPGIMTEEQKTDRENKISNSASSLLETMEAVLLWSKGQMEHFRPSVSEVSVGNLFAYLKRNFPDASPVALTFYGEEDLVIQTDENYLQTILYNLTANAIKALRQTTDGQIVWKAWQEANGIFLSVKDNGPGASDEQLKALYDQSASTGSKYGLGLHIIRDLARAIGCVITVTSQNPAGAEFLLFLPAGAGGVEASEVAAGGAGAGSGKL